MSGVRDIGLCFEDIPLTGEVHLVEEVVGGPEPRDRSPPEEESVTDMEDAESVENKRRH